MNSNRKFSLFNGNLFETFYMIVFYSHIKVWFGKIINVNLKIAIIVKFAVNLNICILVQFSFNIIFDIIEKFCNF